MCIRDRAKTLQEAFKDKVFFIGPDFWAGKENPLDVYKRQDAEGLKKYFAANAKALLDKGVRIEEVNGTKSLFTISPADVYKRQVVNGLVLSCFFVMGG